MDFDTNDSINPELPELEQEEDQALPAVDVRHVGPVKMHRLPARIAYSRNVNVVASSDPVTLENIASEDLRRSYIKVVCTGNPIFIGHTKQDVADGVAAILPINTLIELPTSAPVWVRGSGGAAVVSYWIGNWAD